MECPACLSTDVTTHTQTVHRLWGSPAGRHGQHSFAVKQTSQHCGNCGEEWLTGEQATAADEALNEQIKSKLGFDWLAHNRERSETQPEMPPSTFTRDAIVGIFQEATTAKLEGVKILRQARTAGKMDDATVLTYERGVQADLVSLSLFFERFGFTFEEFTQRVAQPAMVHSGVRLDIRLEVK